MNRIKIIGAGYLGRIGIIGAGHIGNGTRQRYLSGLTITQHLLNESRDIPNAEVAAFYPQTDFEENISFKSISHSTFPKKDKWVKEKTQMRSFERNLKCKKTVFF